MTNLLLIISFILNFIALFLIVNLYVRQNRFLEIEKKHEKLLAEMDDVVSAYLLEMNEENEKFLKRLEKIIDKKTTLANTGEKVGNELENFESKIENLVAEEGVTFTLSEEAKKKTPVLRKSNHYQAVTAYKTMSNLEKGRQNKDEVEGQKNADEYNEQYIYEQAILLKNEGLSIEEIAKRLHKGKTEIELLLKLKQISD